MHYGFARVVPLPSSTSSEPGSSSSASDDAHDVVWPMVMSIGWNPFYNNTTRTSVRSISLSLELGWKRGELIACFSGWQEVHILHDYPHDFYGRELRVVILGFIRPEFNYAGLGPSLPRPCSPSS